MLKINSLDVDAHVADPSHELWLYNCFDCAVTCETLPKIASQLDEHSTRAYHFSLAMLAPALDMMFRGMRVDRAKQDEFIYKFEKAREQYERQLLAILKLGVGVEPTYLGPKKAVKYLWNSNNRLKALLYGVMGLPEQQVYDKETKAMKVTVNRDALEALMEEHIDARPICSHILAIRDAKKLLDVAQTGVSRDGRIRCSYNVAGTALSRWSSSTNAFNEGTNLQNITDTMREMFIADKGKKLGYVDLEQAESRVVAVVSGCQAYIDACNSGDLHTTSARMVWPELQWIGEIKPDRLVAEQKFYRHFSYRDMSKRGGHLFNYLGKAMMAAKHLKIAFAVAKAFGERYLGAFKGIPLWHDRVARFLAEHKYIMTAVGRRIYFFDRTNTDDTIKDAVAADPQSTIGDILNRGMWRVWRANQVQLLLQVHDCIVFQFDDNPEAERRAVTHVMAALDTTLTVDGRSIRIGAEALTGWNWRKRSVEKDGTIVNPSGLMKWSPNVPDTRKAPEYSALHRRVSTVN